MSHQFLRAHELRRGDEVPASPYATRWVDGVRELDEGQIIVHWLGTGTASTLRAERYVSVLARHALPTLHLADDVTVAVCGICGTGHHLRPMPSIEAARAFVQFRGWIYDDDAADICPSCVARRRRRSSA